MQVAEKNILKGRYTLCYHTVVMTKNAILSVLIRFRCTPYKPDFNLPDQFPAKQQAKGDMDTHYEKVLLSGPTYKDMHMQVWRRCFIFQVIYYALSRRQEKT